MRAMIIGAGRGRRLMATTLFVRDCGLPPAAAKVDIDEVYLKLRAEAEAAQVLRARHG